MSGERSALLRSVSVLGMAAYLLSTPNLANARQENDCGMQVDLECITGTCPSEADRNTVCKTHCGNNYSTEACTDALGSQGCPNNTYATHYNCTYHAD